MNKTSQHIADLCGVSRGTVDRALNNRPGINPETKQKILKVAEELGYKPHILAQGLVKGKTFSVGTVVFDLNNRVFPQLINSIESRLRERGYFFYLTLSNKNPQTELECIDHLASRKVDGIILLSVNKGKVFTNYLENLGIPIVTFANQISSRFSHVWIDDRQAIKDAVKHLVSKQYEEILYVSPPLSLRGKTNLYAVEQRYKGFLEAVKETNLSTVVIDQKNYLDVLYKLLTRNSKRKAILCTSDIYAIKIVMSFRDKGISFPKDAGIIGFDNIDILKFAAPSIATVGYSPNEIGMQIVDSLLNQINGNSGPSKSLFGHQIIEGDSL